MVYNASPNAHGSLPMSVTYATAQPINQLSSRIKVGDTLVLGTTGVSYKILSKYTAGQIVGGNTSWGEDGFMASRNGQTSYISNSTINNDARWYIAGAAPTPAPVLFPATPNYFLQSEQYWALMKIRNSTNVVDQNTQALYSYAYPRLNTMNVQQLTALINNKQAGTTTLTIWNKREWARLMVISMTKPGTPGGAATYPASVQNIYRQFYPDLYRMTLAQLQAGL